MRRWQKNWGQAPSCQEKNSGFYETSTILSAKTSISNSNQYPIDYHSVWLNMRITWTQIWKKTATTCWPWNCWWRSTLSELAATSFHKWETKYLSPSYASRSYSTLKKSWQGSMKATTRRLWKNYWTISRIFTLNHDFRLFVIYGK